MWQKGEVAGPKGDFVWEREYFERFLIEDPSATLCSGTVAQSVVVVEVGGRLAWGVHVFGEIGVTDTPRSRSSQSESGHV